MIPVLDAVSEIGLAAMTDLDHAACWLLGNAAMSALASLDRASGLVSQAVEKGELAAESYGIPASDRLDKPSTVLAAALQFATDLMDTAAPRPRIDPWAVR